MSSARLRPAAAPLAIAAAVLALGTAAAPAGSLRTVRPAPKLVVTPARLAPAQAIAPGDRVERLVELRRRGRGRLAAAFFHARARKSSALDSDRQHGLRVAIDRCSKRWSRRGTGYVCRGKRVSILAQRPFAGRTKLKLKRLALGAEQPSHLRLVLTLPADAGNALQGRSTEARYSFVGVAARR
jgi:hypothetical protein